jgi:8-oxo-dGTP diphosphatase
MNPKGNAYEIGSQKVIPAVLLYAFHGDQVLMIHRNANPQDDHLGKWNGLGGKLEWGESPLQSAVREFREESGCDTSPTQWKWIGQLHFPNFKPHKQQDWSVTVFRCELTEEQVKQVTPKNNEGTLAWIPSSEVRKLALWPGDIHFIPYVLSHRPFQGTFWYQNGLLSDFFCHPILD